MCRLIRQVSLRHFQMPTQGSSRHPTLSVFMGLVGHLSRQLAETHVLLMLNSLVFNSQSPMHRFVHALAVCMVTLHIMGGCCWHHDHTECLSCSEDDDRSADSLELAVAVGNCELDHCHTGCDEGECAFAAAGSRCVVKASGNLLALGAVSPQVLQARSDVSAYRLLVDGSLPGSSPPFRLHLMIQIFLV